MARSSTAPAPPLARCRRTLCSSARLCRRIRSTRLCCTQARAAHEAVGAPAAARTRNAAEAAIACARGAAGAAAGHAQALLAGLGGRLQPLAARAWAALRPAAGRLRLLLSRVGPPAGKLGCEPAAAAAAAPASGEAPRGPERVPGGVGSGCRRAPHQALAAWLSRLGRGWRASL